MPSPSGGLGPTDGAELLATFLSVALWGTTCMQTLVYFIQYPDDQLTLKALVLWLWLADTVHEILIVKGVYDSQIINFCDYARIQSVVPEYIWQLLFTSLVSITSQVFFTYRIWKFDGEKWIYWILLVPVCLFELGGGLAFLAFGVIVPTAAELVSPIPSSIFIAIQAVAAAADLSIAAGLVILLIRSRKRSFRGSRSVLQKLVILTINTGVWTALFATFTFISILAFKNTLIYAALYFPLCPLYCNTVLANLNAREYLRARSMMDSVVMDSSYNLEPVFSSRTQNSIRTRSMAQSVNVQVEVNKSMTHDDDEPPLRARVIKFDKAGT